MTSDSLHIPISHLVRWTEQAVQSAPHGTIPSAAALFTALVVVTLVAVVVLIGTGYLISWFVRGLP